jgi:hypothetical protein
MAGPMHASRRAATPTSSDGHGARTHVDGPHGVARIVMARESILIVDDKRPESAARPSDAPERGLRCRPRSTRKTRCGCWPHRLVADSDGCAIAADEWAGPDPADQTRSRATFTAYAMTGDKEKALAAGCDGYLSKPLDMDLLLRVVAEPFTRQVPPQRRW